MNKFKKKSKAGMVIDRRKSDGLYRVGATDRTETEFLYYTYDLAEAKKYANEMSQKVGAMQWALDFVKKNILPR